MNIYPITTAINAVNYATELAYDPSLWPMLVPLDKNSNPIPYCKDASGFIYVDKRTGAPTFTPKDIEMAMECREFAKSNGIQFIDYIIVGKDSFYSFADERVVTLN